MTNAPDRPATKTDLRELRDDMRRDFLQQLDFKITPLVDKVELVHQTLYGEGGRGGIIEDVRDVKAAGKFVKWLASLGGVGGLWAAIKSFSIGGN